MNYYDVKREDCAVLRGKTVELNFPVIIGHEADPTMPKQDGQWTVLDNGAEGLVIAANGGGYRLTIPYRFIGRGTIDSQKVVLLKGPYYLTGELKFTDTISGGSVSN